MFKFTPKQGQYLAFIYNYTKINKRPPAEANIREYFRVTYPTVHQMILKLEENGLISCIIFLTGKTQGMIIDKLVTRSAGL